MRAVSFKGKVSARYEDGKEADRLDDLESSAANKANYVDDKGVLPMMIAVRRRLARKWR